MLPYSHDGIIKWKHFLCYWPFVRGIHRSPVNSPHKGQWRGALIFTLICSWMNGWANIREAGDLRRHHAHYDVTVMQDCWPPRHLSPGPAYSDRGWIRDTLSKRPRCDGHCGHVRGGTPATITLRDGTRYEHGMEAVQNAFWMIQCRMVKYSLIYTELKFATLHTKSCHPLSNLLYTCFKGISMNLYTSGSLFTLSEFPICVLIVTPVILAGRRSSFSAKICVTN